jgi:molybdopterin-guanine dinucleotide biosynthesis protein A
VSVGARSAEGFVLAGGQSTRMGRDKATLLYEGQPLIVRSVDRLTSLGLRVRIAGSRPDLAEYADVVEDRHPGCGPLSGLEAALAASDAELNVFTAVDLPHLPAMFLDWMIWRAEHTGALGTIPMLAGRPQPLCAVYHRMLHAGLARALRADDCKVMHAVERAAKGAVDAFSMERVVASRWDWSANLPVQRWFENLNTPSDLKLVERTSAR